MATYTVSGQRLYIREEGQASGQIALLIHGWSSSWFAMSPLLPLLRKRFSCVVPDLPGYGNSPPLPRRATIGGYADLLAALIRDVTDGPVVLVGHSMGGMISLTLALRHPVLVERMVLLNPTISGHLSSLINLAVSPVTLLERFSVANRIIAGVEPHLLTVTDRLMRPVSFAERSEITEQDYKRLRADARRPGQGRVRAECFWAMREGDLRGRLHQIETPSMVLWGAEDNTVPLRDAGVVADEWPAADLRIIPKAGHWPQFETPLLTKRYIADYLGVPLATTRLDEPKNEADVIDEAAQFLGHSDVGTGLTLEQRTRLASLCSFLTYEPHGVIARANEPGNDLYIVRDGTVEVWSDPLTSSQSLESAHHLASLTPGQITGELSLLDGGRRSASLQAGPEGATVMVMRREQLEVLREDDSALGNRLIWNIATSLALRLRHTNWQLHQARQERRVVRETPVH
jgi:pimeloyl-ACP methyl ester carboxylesterase